MGTRDRSWLKASFNTLLEMRPNPDDPHLGKLSCFQYSIRDAVLGLGDVHGEIPLQLLSILY